jgi:hypothetical protein
VSIVARGCTSLVESHSLRACAVAESSPTRLAILASKLFSSFLESRACSVAADRARERRMLEMEASPPGVAVKIGQQLTS